MEKIFFKELLYDETIYKVIIDNIEQPTKEDVRIIFDLIEKNYLDTFKLLKKGIAYF